MTDLTSYGPWAIVAGGSDGVGAAFARALAVRGMNLVLVARRAPVLDTLAADIRTEHQVQVRTVSLDLSVSDSLAELEEATSNLEIGLFIYNAGGDDRSVPFLDKSLDAHLTLVQRNCASVLEAVYRFGGPMVARGRGAVIVVTSGAAWVGGANMAAYGATKAFDLVLAEALWAEWRDRGVDVLALVLGATNTPSLHRAYAATGKDPHGDLADPAEVVTEALDHLSDGPTWIVGSSTPVGGSPFGAMSRRDAVELLSRAAATSH